VSRSDGRTDGLTDGHRGRRSVSVLATPRACASSRRDNKSPLMISRLEINIACNQRSVYSAPATATAFVRVDGSGVVMSVTVAAAKRPLTRMHARDFGVSTATHRYTSADAVVAGHLPVTSAERRRCAPGHTFKPPSGNALHSGRVSPVLVYSGHGDRTSHIALGSIETRRRRPSATNSCCRTHSRTHARTCSSSERYFFFLRRVISVCLKIKPGIRNVQPVKLRPLCRQPINLSSEL
jgi:hypothetical protein